MELFTPQGASSASPVPQINSQPASHALTSSFSSFHSISVSTSLSLPARGTCCPHVSFPCQPPAQLPVMHACLASSLSTALHACLSSCQSLHLLFLQSSCLSAFVSVCKGACLSICLSACQLLPLANISPEESGRLSAAPPFCLTICHLFIICLCLHLFVC